MKGDWRAGHPWMRIDQAAAGDHRVVLATPTDLPEVAELVAPM
jgi:hypothetical protein